MAISVIPPAVTLRPCTTARVRASCVTPRRGLRVANSIVFRGACIGLRELWGSLRNAGAPCRAWVAVLMCFVSGVGGSAELSAETLRRSGEAVTLDYFGLHMHRVHTVTPWPSVSFGSWRLLDAYVNWFNLEPKRGQWDFKTLDRYVQLGEQHGVSLLLPLAFPPSWASRSPGEKGAYGAGSAAPPRDLGEWRQYVRVVAERYRQSINEFEIWNEPNLRNFFSGSQDDLVLLARVAHETLREVTPRSRLVSPSVTGGVEHVKWLDSYLERGGGQYADVVGFHFYAPQKEPEAMLPLIRDVQAVMKRRGLQEKPLWNTESGWWIANTDGTPEEVAVHPSWRRLDPELAAAYVGRALILGWAAGLDRFYWYAWDNYSMGLIEPGRKTMKPGAVAYATTVDWLLGAVVSECVRRPEGLWVCELSRGVEEALIVWTERGEKEFMLPAEWKAERFDTILGEARKIAPGSRSVTVSEAPLRIVRASHGR